VQFSDPRLSFDANTQAWFSINQSVAFGLNVLDLRLDASSRWPARVAQLSAGLWANAMLRYYSHEMAHEYLYRNSGAPIHSGPELSQWTSSYLPGFYYPLWQKNAVESVSFSDDQLLLAIAAGLNQDELNARTVWRNDLTGRYIDYYNALSFLLTKFRDDAYILQSGSDERPFAPGQKIDHLSQAVFADSPQLYDDMNLYRLALLNQGIEVNNGKLLRQSLAADLLTWKTWQSIYAVFQFIRGGGSLKNIKIPLPLISYYLTPSGGFYNFEFPLHMAHNRLMLVNFGIQSVKQTALNRPLRFGAEFSALHLGSRLQLAPFAYWTLNTQIDDGFSVGVNSYWHFHQSTALWLLFEYHQNDVLQDIVKSEKPGARIRIGFCKSIVIN
jgi:hypothetical protein